MTTREQTQRRGGAGESGGGGSGGSRAVRWTVVGGVLLAVLAGCGGITAGVLSGQGYLPGDGMREVWNTPADGTSRAYGNGSWAVGDVLVRSRYDAVTGFDAGSGATRWTFEPPAGAEVCAVSRTAEDGIALVAHGVPAGFSSELRPGEGCGTVTALSLSDGRALWHTARTPLSGELRAASDVVAAGAGLAVLRDEDVDWAYRSAEDDPGRLDPDRSLRAVDLRTGKPKWSAKMPAGCVPYGVAADGRQVAALLVCDYRDMRIAVLDPADGRVRGVAPLDARQYTEPVRHAPVLLSADPLVVSVRDLDEAGHPTYLAFGPDARPRGRIASGVRNGRLPDPVAEPALVRIAHGRLYAVAAEADYDDVLTAFDLRSGERLWRREVADLDDIIGLRVAAGRVTALIDLYGSEDEDGLFTFDADTGDERDQRTFPDSVGDSSGEVKDVYGHRDRLIAARWGNGYYAPFTAYEER
ncbi:PQQ-binding-like beta-propeller repeat protein [Streptomyces termitum]|uniref:outer membrane protein assembly factor BamB family protein n=1 Tax=Streptomyces termitum TaxID=67368 RepID=UPI0033A7C978